MNKVSFRQVECFLEVSRDLSFSRAAARLNLAQPPLSRHIQELEATVGCRLFERSSRKVRLTAAGMAFLEQVCSLPPMLNKAIDAARRACSGEEDRLRIGFVSAILNDSMLETFRSFRSEHPTCRLELTEGSPAELIAQLGESELDGAFLGVAVASPPAFLVQRHWRSEPLRVCLPVEHAFNGRKTVSLLDLQGESFVTLSEQTAPSYRAFLDALLHRYKVSVQTVQEVNSVAALLSLVVAGSGVALLPASAVVFAHDYIYACGLQEPEAVLEEVFVHRRKGEAALKAFLDLL